MDVAHVIHWREVAEEKIGQKPFLYLSVLPQDVILEFLHQLSIDPQQRAGLHHSNEDALAFQNAVPCESHSLTISPLEFDPLRIDVLENSLKAEHKVYHRVLLDELFLISLAG
jgi:hypothetical protein